jgi:hypothetical protein
MAPGGLIVLILRPAPTARKKLSHATRSDKVEKHRAASNAASQGKLCGGEMKLDSLTAAAE